MTRITIGPFIVPADLRESLLRECEETGAPQGELVRRAIRSYLEERRQRSRPGAGIPATTRLDINRNDMHKDT